MFSSAPQHLISNTLSPCYLPKVAEHVVHTYKQEASYWFFVLIFKLLAEEKTYSVVKGVVADIPPM
jgi:hypothetical protein